MVCHYNYTGELGIVQGGPDGLEQCTYTGGGREDIER